jgi:Glycosyltransferase family 28 N-terminal domain
MLAGIWGYVARDSHSDFRICTTVKEDRAFGEGMHIVRDDLAQRARRAIATRCDQGEGKTRPAIPGPPAQLAHGNVGAARVAQPDAAESSRRPLVVASCGLAVPGGPVGRPGLACGKGFGNRAGVGRIAAVRILIVTAGSRGDVAPFTGLGQRLQEAGHQVALAAHDTFAGLVRGCGLEHRPLPGDPRDLVRARTAAGSQTRTVPPRSWRASSDWRPRAEDGARSARSS